jgi:hypothetical protein
MLMEITRHKVKKLENSWGIQLAVDRRNREGRIDTGHRRQVYSQEGMKSSQSDILASDRHKIHYLLA